MPVDTDDAIHAIHRSLQSSHECTVHELGKNFYRNYAEYVKIAQEADKFENDLNTMRAMISQLKGFSNEIIGIRDNYGEQNNTPALTDDTAGSFIETPALSVTETDNLVDPELQAKLKRITDLIPDALKFVIDARTVPLESASMAVYVEKQWKPAQCWLLSNGCLITSRKAKVSLTQGVRHKLTFERFYPVEGLLLSNVKNTADLQNCFKLKNPELGSVFLHTEDEEAKEAWMRQIQKIIQDNQEQKLRNESGLVGKFMKQPSESKHRRTSSACTSGTSTRPSLIDSGFDNQELSPDAAYIFEKTLEDLAEALSCTNYDLSLDLVEKLKFDFDKVNFSSATVNSLKIKFNELKNQLASFLFTEISDPLISQGRMVDFIQKLIVLGYVEDARERFLIGRSELIKGKTLKIQYYGDVLASVSLLSSITFDSIEKSFTLFNESFQDAKLMSAFVSWARNEISRFCDLFSKQALRRDLPMEILAECVQDALNKCRNLGQCGLDLSIFLEESLGQTLKESLKSRASMYLLRVDEALQKDSFEITIAYDRPDWPRDLFPLKPEYKATESLVQLVQSIEIYLKDVLPIMRTPQMTAFCVAAVYDFIDSFCDKFLRAFYEPNRSNTQLCHIAGNVEVIARVLLPELLEKFPSNASTLVDLKNRTQNTSEAIYSILADTLAKSLAPSEFSSYTLLQASDFDSSLSDWINKAIPVLAKMSRDAPDSYRSRLIDQIVYKILLIFKSALKSNLIKLPNAASIHRFTLDLKFLLHFIEPMITAESRVLHEEIVDIITREFVNDLDRPIPSNSKIEKELEELEKSFSEFSIDFSK